MVFEISFCELRMKRIINIEDGKNLGRAIDVVFNSNGIVLGIVAPNEKSLLKNVVKDDCIFIPWRSVCKIGKDTVLVNLTKVLEGGEYRG